MASENIKAGQYVVCASSTPTNIPRLWRGIVECILKGNGHYMVQIASQIYVQIPPNVNQIALLPNAEVGMAKTALNRQFTADEVDALVAGGATVAAITASGGAVASTVGLGAASVMQGLAAAGGTAVGGILIIASTPALASYSFINAACKASENDETTKDAVNEACAAGMYYSIDTYT
jgi:hypothetical protein